MLCNFRIYVAMCLSCTCFSFWCPDDYEQDSQGAASSTNNQLLCFIVRVCLPVHQGVSPVTYEHKRSSVMRIEEINGQSVIEGLKEASRESYIEVLLSEMGLTDKKRNQRRVLLRRLVGSKTMRVRTCRCML